MGDGLYGVDLKETSEGVYVIEVYDNPNLDHNCEDSGEKGRGLGPADPMVPGSARTLRIRGFSAGRGGFRGGALFQDGATEAVECRRPPPLQRSRAPVASTSSAVSISRLKFCV